MVMLGLMQWCVGKQYRRLSLWSRMKDSGKASVCDLLKYIRICQWWETFDMFKIQTRVECSRQRQRERLEMPFETLKDLLWNQHTHNEASCPWFCVLYAFIQKIEALTECLFFEHVSNSNLEGVGCYQLLIWNFKSCCGAVANLAELPGRYHSTKPGRM